MAVSNIYSLKEEDVPGDWRYRSDYIWRNTETNELLVVSEGTMRKIEDRENCYQVNIHIESGVETILDNISKERAKKVVTNYIENGEIPEDSWMNGRGGN